MAATLSTADSILKDFYVGPIQEQLNQEVFLLQTYEEEVVEWQGRKAVVPAHVARNGGTGFRDENSALPTATNQGYVDMEVLAKFMYGRFGFTGPALEFTETDKGAFEPVMTGEMKRVAEDCRNVLDKAAFTGGRMIGLVWQQQNGATWQYSGRPDLATDANWGVRVNDANTTVRLVNLTDYSFVGAATRVNSISETVLVLNAPVDSTATADGTLFGVLYNDAANPTDRSREMGGVLTNLCDPTHYTVDRTAAANAELRSNFLVADFTAAAPVYTDLTLDAIQILMDKILLKSNSAVDYMAINPVHRQSYTTLLQGTIGGVPNAVRMDVKDGKRAGDAGFLKLGYADVPFRTAQHCPKGQVHLQTKSAWSLLQRRKGDFAQGDGKVLNKVTDRDAYEGFWKQYLNLLAKRPNANGILAGVSFYGV